MVFVPCVVSVVSEGVFRLFRAVRRIVFMVVYLDYIVVLNGIACVLNQGFKRNLSSISNLCVR